MGEFDTYEKAIMDKITMPNPALEEGCEHFDRIMTLLKYDRNNEEQSFDIGVDIGDSLSQGKSGLNEVLGYVNTVGY